VINGLSEGQLYQKCSKLYYISVSQKGPIGEVLIFVILRDRVNAVTVEEFTDRNVEPIECSTRQFIAEGFLFQD